MDEPRPSRRSRRDPRLQSLAEDSGYEIHDRIAAGGMGIVYRARDADGNDVAIKLLRHEIADDPRARERLAREVSAQRLVSNENIARILDAELDSSEAFVVTEFVPGPTLEDAVRAHGGLHPEAVREVGLVMGESLREIHRAGVVHRDLKPSNILLRGASESDLQGFDPDGDRLDPVIIDFGIAIAAEESRLTSTGLVMGTAAYLDPEVVRSNHAGPEGDWWAWAALLAFAATGREPYGTGRVDLVFLRAERGEIDLEGTPTQLAEWLPSALQADPAARPRPDELLARLAELDLSVYDDPGPTETLDAGTRTAVLPVMGGDGAPHAAQGAFAGPAETAPTGEAPQPSAEPATEALPRASDSDGPAEPATEALPRASDSPGSAEPPTEALPRVPDSPASAEPPTEALPPMPARSAPAEPATEVLPVAGPPTTPMPVVPPAPQQSAPYAGSAAPSAERYPVQRGTPAQLAPQHQPAPQPRTAPPAWDHQAPPQVPGHQAYPPAGMWAPPQPPPPRRPLLVWTGHLLLIALAGVAPYVSLAVFLLLGATARTWERSHQAVASRRLRGVTGAGPMWGAGIAAPFRFLLGLLEIALQALLPLVLGLLMGVAVDASWTLLQTSPPPDAVVFAIAMAVTLLITWVGLGSRTTRAGAHRMLDAAAPDRVWTAVVGVLLALVLAAVVTTLLARQGMVDYFPFPDVLRLDDIALWRR